MRLCFWLLWAFGRVQVCFFSNPLSCHFGNSPFIHIQLSYLSKEIKKTLFKVKFSPPLEIRSRALGEDFPLLKSMFKDDSLQEFL